MSSYRLSTGPPHWGSDILRLVTREEISHLSSLHEVATEVSHKMRSLRFKPVESKIHILLYSNNQGALRLSIHIIAFDKHRDASNNEWRFLTEHLFKKCLQLPEGSNLRNALSGPPCERHHTIKLSLKESSSQTSPQVARKRGRRGARDEKMSWESKMDKVIKLPKIDDVAQRAVLIKIRRRAFLYETIREKLGGDPVDLEGETLDLNDSQYPYVVSKPDGSLDYHEAWYLASMMLLCLGGIEMDDCYCERNRSRRNPRMMSSTDPADCFELFTINDDQLRLSHLFQLDT